MKSEYGRELNEAYFDAPISTEVAGDAGAPEAPASAPPAHAFYENVDVEALDEEGFEQFWADLAQKNAPAFEGAGTEAEAAEEAAEAVAEPAPEAAARELEAACERLRKLLHTRTVDREIYRRTLAFCTPMQDFNETEAAIQNFPEYGCSDQSPYRYIKTLISEGGLFQWDLDEAGAIIEPEDYEGLTEDEIDDLIFSYGLETTEAGRIVAEEYAPEKRLNDVLNFFPDRADIFQELLGYIKNNHCKYDDIQALFKGRDFSALKTLSTEPHIQLQPSVFLDNMERAGGIVWKDRGWCLTREGEAFLEQLIARTQAAA